MNINYEQYKIFYYVAKYKNITLAAHELNNNQPNISRAIKALEQELDCKLITRKSRGIELTPAGENLFFYVRNGIQQFQAAEEELQSLISLKQGLVTVGVSETAAYMVLLPALNAFKKEYPHIRVKLLNHNTHSAIDLAKQGLVDFSITSLFDSVEAPLTATTVLTYSDLLVGGPSHKNIKIPLSLKEISTLPLISLPTNTATYAFYNNLFQKNGLSFHPLYEVETTGQLCPMLIYDLGVAFLPAVYVQNSLNQKTVFTIPTKEPLPSRNISIIENKLRYPNHAAEKLKEFCMVQRQYISF